MKPQTIINKLKTLITELESEQHDPYAELKEAHAAGKMIQSNIFGAWVDIKQGNLFFDIAPCYLRIKPEETWTLSRQLPGFRELAEGEEWHRQDFTREMLPEGKRPLLLNEACINGDEIQRRVKGAWEVIDSSLGDVDDRPTYAYCRQCRTTRPLPLLTPAQVAEGWQLHEGGENPAPGKKVDWIFRDGNTGTNSHSVDFRWKHTGACGDITAYRIIGPATPATRTVKLGPEDVPPMSVFRFKGHADSGYYIPTYISSPMDGRS